MPGVANLSGMCSTVCQRLNSSSASSSTSCQIGRKASPRMVIARLRSSDLASRRVLASLVRLDVRLGDDRRPLLLFGIEESLELLLTAADRGDPHLCKALDNLG